MKYYTKPCIDWILMHNGDVQTSGGDLLSVSEDNDLIFDWTRRTGGGSSLELIPTKGISR
jgi:hypothetical protein